MENQVAMVNGNLVCLIHQQPIKMIIIDKNVPFKDTLLCQQCFDSTRTLIKNIINLNQAMDMIKQGYENTLQSQKIQTPLNVIMEFQSKFSELETSFTNQFKSISKMTQDWIDGILSLGNVPQQIDLLKELRSLYERNFQQNQNIYEELENNNISIFKKIESQILQFPEITKCLDGLAKIFKKKNLPTQVIKQKSDEQVISKAALLPQIAPLIPLQASLPQIIFKAPEIPIITNVFAIAFNKLGNIMVSGHNNNQIKVWQYKPGSLKLMQTLEKHNGIVSCLAFSLRKNIFISGSHDKSICCWQEKSPSNFINSFPAQWVVNGPFEKHNQRVTKLIINNAEDELISCSYSKQDSIIVWSLDIEKNQLTCKQLLCNNNSSVYTQCTYSISYNESSEYFVSTNEKFITLWQKDQQKIWYSSKHIQTNGAGNVQFISENYINYFQFDSLFLRRFVFQNSFKLVFEQTSELQLNQDKKGKFYEHIEHLKYNKNAKQVILSYGSYIYQVQVEDGRFKTRRIFYLKKEEENAWTLSQDNQYLIYWDSMKNDFEIIQMTYE